MTSVKFCVPESETNLRPPTPKGPDGRTQYHEIKDKLKLQNKDIHTKIQVKIKTNQIIRFLFSLSQCDGLDELLISFKFRYLCLSELQKLWVGLHLLELGVRWSCGSVKLVEGLLLQSSLSEGSDIVRFCVEV